MTSNLRQSNSKPIKNSIIVSALNTYHRELLQGKFIIYTSDMWYVIFIVKIGIYRMSLTVPMTKEVEVSVCLNPIMALVK